MKNYITMLMGLLCLVLSANAQQKPLDNVITVNYTNTPLINVLADLQKRYGIEFTYSSSEIMLQQNVTLSIKGKTGREVFNKLFKPLNISYYEVGTGIVLKKFSKSADKEISGGKGAKMVTISGFIREKGSLETMPSASVYIPELKYSTQSNTYGFYSLTVPEGEYVIEYSFVGYTKVTETLSLEESLKHDVFIVQTNTLKEVVIKADKSVPISQDNRMSTIDIPMATVKRMPGLLGEKDVFKIIQMYPGVQRGVEGTSGFYVRGGTSDQNLVILDDAPIYNASHAFGLFSIFNGDAIKSAELIKGAFPARYGERLSSILVANMKDGNKEKMEGEVGVGLIASRFTLEGPIQKGKSSFLVSGRRSYADLLIKPFLKKGKSGGYYFYDLNAKVNTEIDPNNHLYLSAYLGKDNLYSGDKDSTAKSKFNFGWGNQTVTARWNHVFNNKTFGNASFIYSNYHFETANNDETREEKTSSRYTSQIKDFGFKYDLDYAVSHDHALRVGVRTVAHRFSPSIYQNTGTQSYNNSSEGESISSWENNAYAEDTWTLSKRITVNGGVRASGFTTQGTTYTSVEPRISTRVSLTNTLAVKGSYSVMNQYLFQLSNSSLGLPTDLWVPATKNIGPERSDQFALGIAKDFDDQKYALSIEAYHKNMNHLVTYKEGATYLNLDLDANSDIPKQTRWEDQVTTGKGKSDGLEFLLEKKKGRLTGWIGYTLSKTTFQFDQVNNGNPFRPPHDRRHNLSVAGLYDISKDVKFSFAWAYMSGSPMTVVQSIYNVDINGPVKGGNSSFPGLPGNLTDYSSKGAHVGDAYSRLDVGVQFIKQKKHGIRTWDLSAYNVYNKFNTFYYDYEQQGFTGGTTGTLKLKKYSYVPFVPSITYSYKF